MKLSFLAHTRRGEEKESKSRLNHRKRRLLQKRKKEKERKRKPKVERSIRVQEPACRGIISLTSQISKTKKKQRGAASEENGGWERREEKEGRRKKDEERAETKKGHVGGRRETQPLNTMPGGKWSHREKEGR